MKKIISIITLSTLLSTSSLFGGGNIAPVVPIEEIDPNPFYVGVGLMWAGVSRDCFGSGTCPDVRLKDSTWGGIIRAGYDYNQYIGIEVRALQSSIDTDWADKTTHYGIFLKPMMPVGEQMNIYGLLGYGHTKIEVDCSYLKDEFTYDGFSYGIGLEYDLSDREDDREEGSYDRPFDGHGDQEKGWGLWVDYQNLMNNEGPNNYKANIVTFGITYDF
ncbi:MAG: porin family protein [Sulfurovum sp.]|uniref:porin family protein n=1 Tax=Sulfurovum sp. TaxID=1969726 RepID=UPI002867C9AB|nr:porin family protein [Sulfurovum sp.]MCO4845696.1 porin family protein [Sulfurovum sp.]